RLMLLAPVGTPAAITDKVNEAVRTVLASADLAQAAALQGAIPAYMEPAQLGPEMQRESAAWAAIIKSQKISAE
ncbi:MAG: tripartite tricarboxylate transporter substrate binding protein, partial [Ramlibacter sp.]|nr:tripartite tricarboxylate transporter substrate binding protein [Ramlibacter sp.]